MSHRFFRLTPPKPPRLSENDVESACVQLCQLRGYWITRLHSGTFKSVDGKRWIKACEKGTPDYATLHARRPGFLLEVKRPGEQPSPDQLNKINEIVLGYSLAIAVVDSVEALALWINDHERRNP